MATHSSRTSLAASPSPSSGSESPSRASGSRDSVSASASSKGIFYPADTTFNPSPYQPPQRTLPVYRPASVNPVGPAIFDAPQSTAPPFDGMFIHPPFNNLPDNVALPAEGMNYSVMHQHPTWFLDIKDFITLDASPDGAIRYPRDLEPPRPRRQKDLLLRCTFCPRTYAGVNAKSMWTRHVREKHRVVLSKAWSDTATSSRRQSTGKATTGPLLPIDTATSSTKTSPSASGKSPLTTVPLKSKPSSPAVPRAKPGPKPKNASPAKGKKAVGAPRKIVIPAQKPKPLPPLPVTGWVKSVSPPPPIGMLPPRMRPSRKSFRASQGPLELQALLSGEAAVSDTMQAVPVASASETGAPAAADHDSISSTPPPRDTPDAVAPPSTSSASVPIVVTSSGEEPAVVDPPEQTRKSSDDGDSIQTDKEVADLLLMDVDVFIDEPYEDVDMELEEEEEGLHPPISLGGLVEPMFGVEDVFSLASRPLVAMSPVFSPALSPAAPHSTAVSREPSVEDVVARPVTPEPMEPPVEEETPPLGRFKVSSLAYLMDKNLSVSPPHSPPTSTRSLTPLASSSTDMEDEPAATMFAALQDVFVIKMQNMNPELKAQFLGHLQEQFGVQVKADPQGSMEGEDSAPWASLPESVVRQIMSEHARSNREDEDAALAPMAVDGSGDGGDFADLTAEFKQGSAGQLKEDLEDQLKELVGQFTDELAVPLQDALTLQLKDEIIVQVADQMMEALVVQGEEAQVEFEWRRRFLERQLWDTEDPVDAEEVIQHPLHHLFLSKATPADMDMRILC